jgi:hypothetical protein
MVRSPCVARSAAGAHFTTARLAPQIRFILLQNRQGRTRLAKYYVPLDDSEKRKLEFDIHRLVVNRDPKFTNFLEARPARRARLGAKTHAESFRCSAPRAAQRSVSVSDATAGVSQLRATSALISTACSYLCAASQGRGRFNPSAFCIRHRL